MIAIKVRMFAMLRDCTGAGELRISLADSPTIDRLFENLISSYPGLKQWQAHVRFAVNNEYVGREHILLENDEVALIPPVSGG